MQRRVLDALGMKSSSFTPTPEVKKHLADAVMWTYHGREFPAPTFELGMAPAGCMYSTVLDLAKFQSCLFADGKVGDKQLLKPETHRGDVPAAVRQRQDAKRGFGLGFMVGELEGQEAGRPRRRDLRLRHRVRGAAGREARRDRRLARATSSNAVDDAHRRRRPAADARGEGRQAAAEDRDERAAAGARKPRTRRPLPGRRPAGSTSPRASAGCT